MNPDEQSTNRPGAGADERICGDPSSPPPASQASLAAPGLAPPYTSAEKASLLQIARDAIRHLVLYGTEREFTLTQLPNSLLEKRACFVTLFKDRSLRGCIGHMVAREPLYLAVAEAACGAAMRDPRFPPVRPEEISQLQIEISILGEPQELLTRSPEELLAQLSPGRHGVMLRVEGRTSTFLPQVWQQLPDKEEFLGRLAQKAGCSFSAWRSPDARVSVYETHSFEES